jgi:hypothetical protein
MKGNTREFYCETCRQTAPMSLDAMREHLRTVHKKKVLQGMRRMLAHIDGRDTYEFTWEWKFGKVLVTEHTVNKRSKADRRMWA